MKINFGDIKSSTLDSLPEDRYQVKIENAILKTTNDGLNQMVALTFVVMDGEFKKRKLWENVTLTEKSLWRLKQILEFSGSPLAAKEADIQDVIDDIIGRYLDVYAVPDKTNTGNPTNKITTFYESSLSEEETSPESDIPSVFGDA